MNIDSDRPAKVFGAIFVALFTGEHLAHFLELTPFHLSQFERIPPERPFSTDVTLRTNVDHFIGENLPTIVSFLFSSNLCRSR